MAKQKNKYLRGDNKKNKKDDELLVDIVDAQEQARDFFERNQKYILGGLLAFVLIVGGGYAFSMFKNSKNTEALEQMYKAEFMFKIDSLDKALNDPGGGYPGFLGIIEDYGSTDAGNLANYYAGAIYLQKGEYQNAIDYLSDYSSDGKVTPATTNGMIGDAYAELGNTSEALSYYKKAANKASDEFTKPFYLFKTGLLLKREGNTEEATKYFEQIKNEYPTSIQGRNIDAYIAKG